MLDSKLLQDVEALSKHTGMDFDQLRVELEGLIGNVVIISHFITYGPNRTSPQTLGEVFAVSEQCLYDYEIQEKGPICHVLFLDSITEISEEQSGDEFFSVHFRGAGGAGLLLVDQKDKKDQIREFCTALRDRVLASKGRKL